MLFLFLVRKAPVSPSAVALGAAAALVSLSAEAAAPAPTESLDTVVVTATRSPASARTATSALTVISADEIRKSGVDTVFEAIRKLGGFVGKQDLSNGGNDTIDLRGFGDATHANTVVLINGIRVSETDLSSARLSGVPVDQIERIEVQRGGSSVLWGEGATSGVIHVVLKDGAALVGPRSSLGGSIDSLGGYVLHGATAAKVGAWALDATVRRQTNPGYRRNAQSDNDVYSVGASLAEGAWSQQLRLMRDEQFSQWPGPLTFDELRQDRRQSTDDSSWGKSVQTRLISNTQWQAGPWMAQLDASARYRSTTSTYYGSESDSAVSNQQVSPKLSYDLDLSWGQWLQTVGVDFQHWKRGTPEGSAPNSGLQINRAVYAYSDVTVNGGTRVNAGVRREFVNKRETTSWSGYERRDAVTSAEFGVSQAVNDQWQVYGRAARSFRLANFDENASTPNGQPLLPQTSQDRELGLRWAAQGAAFNARVFRQDTTHEILYLDLNPLDRDLCCNRNIDPVRRQGVEVDGKWPVTAKVTVTGSAQSLSARFSEGPYAGKQRVLVSPRSATARVWVALSDSQSIHLGAQYLSSSRFGDDFDNTCPTRIPAQVSVDAGYSFERDGWRMGLVVSNLGDRLNYANAYMCQYGYAYPDPGQVIKASLSKQF